MIESPMQTIRCSFSGCGGESAEDGVESGVVVLLFPKLNEAATVDNNRRTNTP